MSSGLQYQLQGTGVSSTVSIISAEGKDFAAVASSTFVSLANPHKRTLEIINTPNKTKKSLWLLVRKRGRPTERPPAVGEF
jgi:hypothetical protein